MMTSIHCTEKAEMCDGRASTCAGTPLAADWLAMAAHWRSLADDGGAQGTVARLMQTGRQARA